MASESHQRSSWMGLPLKHVSLLMLTFQNSALILIMHYSRIMPLVGGQRYLPSTAVLGAEVIKLALCLTMALYDLSSKQPNSAVTTLFGGLASAIFSGDSWKMAIPAMLYTLQNTLQYMAVSNLDASTFQITYQLKILTTALFSVILLKRKLSLRKWLSLLFLTIGVAVVQIPLGSVTADLAALRADNQATYWFRRSMDQWGGKPAVPQLSKRSATYQGIDEDFMLQHPRLNGTVGLVSVIVACISSGLAGVYFEKLLKEHSAVQGLTGSKGGSISVWVRNTQLSLYSLFPALFIGVILKDGNHIARHGFFAGYNWVVWVTIILQALGGVITALVITYANNIAKNFATSISILLSFVASVFFFGLQITFHYLLGTAIVMGATWLYNSHEGPETPAVVIEDFEKTISGRSGQDRTYVDDIESVRRSRSQMRAEVGLSTSRPTTPVGTERHHFRNLSARRQFEKRDA